MKNKQILKISTSLFFLVFFISILNTTGFIIGPGDDPDTVTLYGYVKDSSTNGALYGAYVQLSSSYSTTTNTAGKFTFSDVPDAIYTLSISKSSYVSVSYAISDTANNGKTTVLQKILPPDTTPPTISIVSPSDGDEISGTVIVEASASDSSGIDYVKFYFDGIEIGIDTSSSYTCELNTRLYTEGTYDLKAIAKDNKENTNYDLISVTIDHTTGSIVNKWAVIVGINDYASGDWTDLPSCDNDIAEWATFLNTNGWYYKLFGDNHLVGEYPDHYTLATERNIRFYGLQWLVDNADGNDEVAFVFSGHGVAVGSSSALVTWDHYTAGTEYDGELLDTEVYGILQNCVASKIFLFLDSCHSGGFCDDLDGTTYSSRYFVAAACGVSQVSVVEYTYESKGYYISGFTNGLWTEWFLNRTWKRLGYSTARETIFAQAISSAVEDRYNIRSQWQAGGTARCFDGS